VDVTHEIVIKLLVGLDASTLLIIGSGIAWTTRTIAKRVNPKNIDTTMGLNFRNFIYISSLFVEELLIEIMACFKFSQKLVLES
jgi:hypothetical protein